MKKLILVVLVAFSLIGCTDTDMASLHAYGEAGHVKVYSGGTLIYEGLISDPIV